MEVVFFKTPSLLREWFNKNHEIKSELIVGYYKKHTKIPSITWEESVNEALCFGWIDGIRRSIDDKAYCIRFTPRKTTSIWSNKNINSIENLIVQGLVKPKGLKAYNQRKKERSGIYSFEQEKEAEFTKEFTSLFKSNKNGWSFFQNQPAGYKKTSIHWVMSAKKEVTRKRRLNQLIEDSSNNVRLKHLR